MLKDTNKATNSQVWSLINNCTSDEDHRQELWVHYLSGNSPSTFSAHLEKLKLSYNEHALLQQAAWKFINDYSYARIMEIIVDFSEFERSIIVLLIMGLDIEAISRYKDTSEIRVRQAVTAIRNNSVWKALQVSK